METPRRFIITERLHHANFQETYLTLNHARIQSRHFIYKKVRVNSNSRIISTDEDPSLRIESSAIINLLGVDAKLNK
mgnify:CR=1 FL=1